MGLWKRNFFKAVLFVTIGIIATICIQDVLRANYLYPNYLTNPERTVQGIKKEKENTIEVLTVGTSHMEYGFLPMEFYEQHHIKSYNLATSGQPVQASYHMMRYAMDTQSPIVCIWDPSRLFQTVLDEYAWEYVLEGMPWGRDKIELARVRSRVTDIQFEYAAFPLLRYHSRWKSLNRSDFNARPHYVRLYSKGGGYVLYNISLGVR